MDELERIRAEYAWRESSLPTDRYAVSQPHVLFAQQQKQRLLLKLLVQERLVPLAGKTILDVGCGDGQQLLELVSWGARRSELAGIDLLEGRVARGRVRLGSTSDRPDAEIDLRAGDASHLPWPDCSFDIVLQNTVFTSILDDAMKRNIAREIIRVLKPGGVLIWYDFRFNNPANRQVRGIGAGELRALFTGCAIRLKRLTLAPPLARRLVPISWIGSLLLEKLIVFNTHYLGLIRKSAAGDH
jgi:SAM-dependent methyltransferase